MQIIGFIIVFGVVALGFMERKMEGINIFDWHALVIILGGSLAALMISSKVDVFLRTLFSLKEFIPFFALKTKENNNLKEIIKQYIKILEKNSKVELGNFATSNDNELIKEATELFYSNSPAFKIENKFASLKQNEIEYFQPIVNNWEMLNKLGPSFGMVGTITGMISLFKSMGQENSNIGAAMGLALLATLYGITFGAGFAGPIGQYFERLLDEKLMLIEKLENALLSRSKESL